MSATGAPLDRIPKGLGASQARSLTAFHRALGAELTRRYGGSYPERLAQCIEARLRFGG